MSTKAFMVEGTRIMGTVVEETAAEFVLKDVIAYGFNDAGGGKGMSVQFGAFAPEAEGNKVVLYKSNVTASFEPDESILNHYKTVFGQIVTATPKVQLIS